MTRSLLALSLLLGGTLFSSATAVAAATATAAAAASPAPTAEQQAVYRALSVRHDSPGCDQLDAMSADPLATYLYLIQYAQQPAWVGMRAAHCVLENHSDAALPELERWVSSADTRGLAILTIDSLDQLPLDMAQDLAVRALTDGPDADGMRRRLARSTVPELAALAQLSDAQLPPVSSAGQ